MQNKKIAYIVIILSAVVLLSTAALFFIIYNLQKKDTSLPPINENTNQQPIGTLPETLKSPTSTDILSPSERQRLEKEKKFISEYYVAPELSYSNSAPNYALPIENIKETVLNFRDFSRTVNTDSITESLTNDGFAIIENPFEEKRTDWLASYKTINTQGVPVFITADSVIGVYQTALQVIFREIEEETFYDGLYQVVKQAYTLAKDRYETKFQKLGIESTIASEGSRQEVAFLAVALELLKPKEYQIKQQLTNGQFFTEEEVSYYGYDAPEFLRHQIEEEIKNINEKKDNAKSAVFLKNTAYKTYEIPAHYQTSEKLKNYYLATTWLRENLFPLWHKENGCAECIYDSQDHAVNFVAALFLSEDLSHDQELQNNWANIYKSASFFRGLENDLTYLEYQQAMEDVFGTGYLIDDYMQSDNGIVKGYIALLQKKIHAVAFPEILKGEKISLANQGMRLLRQQYVFENKIINSLRGKVVGQPTENLTFENAPITACRENDLWQRCYSTILDIFAAQKDARAINILNETKNNAFQNYNSILNQFTLQFDILSQNSWHDNAFLALNYSLSKIKEQNDQEIPVFMKSDSWQRKIMKTKAASLVNQNKNISFDKSVSEQPGGLRPYFPYGYVEPQVELYAELLANTEMIIRGFTALQIMPQQSRAFERLEGIRQLLIGITDISIKETNGDVLDADDYSLINDFHRHVRSIIGDVNPTALQNSFSYSSSLDGKWKLEQSISGLQYSIVVYPAADGKLYLAIGPILKYEEKMNDKKFEY